MKNIQHFINEAKNKHYNVGDLHYVMLFKSFKTWLNSVNKDDEFITVALVDTDMNLTEIESSQFSRTYYSGNQKQWVADGDSGSLSVDEWTLSDNDIILVFE